MPWKETCVMDEKIKFIAMVKSGVYSFASACRQFDISRKTGYQLVARYEAEGERGLVERSRARHTHENALSDALALRLLDIKATHVHFGPRKVRDCLGLQGYRGALPAASTIGELFKRYGLVRPRGRRRARSSPTTEPLRHASGVTVAQEGQRKRGSGK